MLTKICVVIQGSQTFDSPGNFEAKNSSECNFETMTFDKNPDTTQKLEGQYKDLGCIDLFS